jgi:ADP-heptose:LPS heptosyltransferase
MAGPAVPGEPGKVLLVLASGLGDTLMFTPALRLLREAWPRARLVALTVREGEREALELNPDLDEVRGLPLLRMGAWAAGRAVLALRREGFELVVLPCPANRVHYNLLAWLTGAPHRAGFRYLQQGRLNLDFLNTVRLCHRDYVHNAEHNLALVERLTGRLRERVGPGTPPISLPTAPADAAAAERRLQGLGAMPEGWVGLHLSSSRVKQMHRKCWTVESFAALARGLGESRPGLGFLVFCGGDDAEASRRFAAMAGPRARLVEGAPVREVAELMRRCRAVVTNDSGLLHVAVAANAPTVAIFGPTNPSRSGPWGGRVTVVRRGIPCSPCFYHTSRDLECPAGLDFACLRELPVEEVRAAVEGLLREGGGRASS